MKRKNAQRSATITSETAMIPRSWSEKATPPMRTGSVENGDSSVRGSFPQIRLARPLSPMSRPIVTITTVSGGVDCTGRITASSIAAPPTKASTSVSANAGQYGICSIRLQATKVVNIAISPWAKLTTPRGAVDEHEREREARVDPAGGEARDDLLQELLHRR